MVSFNYIHTHLMFMIDLIPEEVFRIILFTQKVIPPL